MAAAISFGKADRSGATATGKVRAEEPASEELGQGKLVPAAGKGHDRGGHQPGVGDRHGDSPEYLPWRVAIDTRRRQHR